MSSFPRSPKLLKGGIVLMDAASGVVRQVVALQYNPDTVTRTLQVQGAGAEEGDRSEALRLKGPPVETIKLEAEIDAADALERAGQNPLAAAHGIYPQLAALEAMVYPASAGLEQTDREARMGSFEVAPAESPLILFVWSRNRVVPVRPTELSVTEEAFDPDLNPLRAKVNLSLRVLSVNDLGFDHRGAGIYLAYHKRKESLAAAVPAVAQAVLGLGGT